MACLGGVTRQVATVQSGRMLSGCLELCCFWAKGFQHKEDFVHFVLWRSSRGVGSLNCAEGFTAKDLAQDLLYEIALGRKKQLGISASSVTASRH